MDKRLKIISDNFGTMKIGLDEKFSFQCIMCGGCCINREDIILSPQDIYRMAKELDITVQELIGQYCECHIGSDSRLPLIRVKPRGSVRRCPFMKNHKCFVHRAKPVVCAMYPIGRCLKVEKDHIYKNKELSDQIQYILMPTACGDNTHQYTVREWLDQFYIPVKDQFFIKWQHIILRLSCFLKEEEKTASNWGMEVIWKVACIELYLKYNLERDFYTQFEENIRELFELLQITSKDKGGEQNE